MRKLLLALSLIVGLVPLRAVADPTAWTVDHEKSSVTFEFIEAGKSKVGAFDMYQASIAFDPEKPESASASISVETASISLNDVMREGFLMTVPWFNSERFPVASFRLTGLRPLADGRYLASGFLRIKGVELPVQPTISLSIKGQNARATGTVEIERTKFRLRDALLESVVSIGDKVTIGFDLVATVDLK